MNKTIYAAISLLLIGIASIVPWADAQQKPNPVIIWCQDSSGNYAPCLAGNSLDYDTGGGTVNQGTVGIALPGSGGPVAGGTSTNPVRIDPTGSTTQPVNVVQMNGVTVLMGAGNTGTGSQRVTEATDSQLSAGVGATGDAAATAGGTGSLTAKTRLITTQLDAIQTALQLIDNIVSGSGVNISQYAGATAQSASNGLNTTGGGLPANAMVGQCDDTSPIALTENQFGHARINCTTHQQLMEIGAALPAGNNNIGDVDVASLPALPAGNNNIGDVDVASLPALPAGSNTIGNVNPGTAANWGVYAEDAAETAGGNLSMSGSVRRDTPASSAGTTGDNATINTDGNGFLWARNSDPCTALAKTYIAINIATATTTELTPSLAGVSTNYYVCSLNLVTAAANNVALVDDDTDNCASVTSGLAGGTTAGTGWNFAANGGLTLGNGAGSVFKTNGANRVLCLVTSAATQLSGSMTVVSAP